jgi:glycyl-tRNA synthetase (class II)
MYTFTDSKGRNFSLRPEATASLVRAYIQHRLYQDSPLQKVFMIGPVFRHERPQKGRFRQFHQIDAEIFGDPGPKSDAEIMIRQADISDTSLSTIDERISGKIAAMPEVRSTNGIIIAVVMLPEAGSFFILMGYSPNDFAINTCLNISVLRIRNKFSRWFDAASILIK